MAALAFCSSVITLQRVGGIAIVLEKQDCPGSLCVATLASLTEPPLMFVVLRMAGMAVGRSLVRVEGLRMAGLARGRDMPPP